MNYEISNDNNKVGDFFLPDLISEEDFSPALVECCVCSSRKDGNPEN
jgi:hypothetical protein